jgi:ubiquinone biosynthesis protein Coq4
MDVSPFRAAQALYRLARLVKDPNRLPEVFEMADAIATPKVMQPMVDHIGKDPAGRRALMERHRIVIDLGRLRELPPGTLGRAFADHMTRANLDPEALPYLPSDNETIFVRAHLHETHDIWHVVTGFGTDLVGELGLQAFYVAQTPGALPALLLSVGLLRSALFDPSLLRPFMDAMELGYTMGKSAKPFFGVHWDDWWELPLEDVRARLGVGRTLAAAA